MNEKLDTINTLTEPKMVINTSEPRQLKIGVSTGKQAHFVSHPPMGKIFKVLRLYILSKYLCKIYGGAAHGFKTKLIASEAIAGVDEKPTLNVVQC